MSSFPWDIASAVKLKHFSRCLLSFRQNPSCLRSFSDKSFLYAPTLSSYGSRESNIKIKWPTIAATNDSKNAATETSSSESATTENTITGDQIKVIEEVPPQTPKPLLKRSSLTAREKLRAARVLSKYTESKPVNPAMGSKVLEALRDTDKGKRRPGLPEAPVNMFDDQNRGLGKEKWKFQLPGGNDLFVVIFSFVFISTVMLATTYIVWKAGAIHFNEY